MLQEDKFQFKKRAGGLLGDRKDDDNSSFETYSPDRYSGLKALQTKLQADVDAEIETLDQTKEAIEAEYASLADEIAQLELEEQNEKKQTALLSEKKTAMHSISEKMAEHEAAKVDCKHAMHVVSSKKKVLKEIVGDCESIRTRMDHVKAEMESAEIQLESFKQEGEDDTQDRNNDDRKLRSTQDVADRIKALHAKQQALLDEEAKLRHDEETLQADRTKIHQSVLDRASSLITDLMEQDETIKRALGTCLRTKRDAERAQQAAEDERTIVCARVKVTGQAMVKAEEDVLKVDDFLKTVSGGGMGRKLRGAPEL
jgi:chromosome segregation ATPase